MHTNQAVNHSVRLSCLAGLLFGASFCLLVAVPVARAGAKKKPEPGKGIDNPFPDPYKVNPPDFANIIKGYKDWVPDAKKMKLSQETSFFTTTSINEDSRAYEFVKAAMRKEDEGQYREALQIYKELFTKVLDKYPNLLYRISSHGIFVPIKEFVQRRILRYPKEDLAHYRTLYDAKAKEAFEQARKKYSLQGLSEVVDSMLATSYGDNALLELGNAALDMGHYLEALERFTALRDFFPDSECRTKELDLRIAYCRKMLGDKAPTGSALKGKGLGTVSAKRLKQFEDMIRNAKVVKPPFHSQFSSAPNIAQDDYTLLPPTTDPIGLEKPVWDFTLPGSREDFYIHTQPVVTTSSLIYRHKNIIYARSLLNGELRWKNDLGGRATWQSFGGRQFPQEDILVQDGLVFTPLYKVGPSLVALDEITGAMKWAYGPMVASNEEEALMRFEAAPAGGPRSIYAGYVLDNINGNTHTDTEYGVMAFESRSGRVLWRASICRLPPEKFSGGFAKSVRNRIRSFTSPPLYHQGTVYYNTNAGAMVALDARSGRVKWLMRYPFYPGVHDATRQFGRGGGTVKYTKIFASPHSPMFWYNQRPLVVGESLYIAPVDTPFLFSIDRRSGRVNWSKPKGKDNTPDRRQSSGGASYFMGPISSGELLIVYSGRGKSIRSGVQSKPIHLVDPKTGKTTWMAGDLTVPCKHPVLVHHIKISKNWAQGHGLGLAYAGYQTSARPLVTTDDKLYLGGFCYVGYPIFDYVSQYAYVDLRSKKVLGKRRYIAGNILAACRLAIKTIAPTVLKSLEEVPHKNDKLKEQIKITREIAEDTFPENQYGPFLPFSRVTFKYLGVLFEVRMSPRKISMNFDKEAVRAALKKQSGPEAEFARAELALADSRVTEAAEMFNNCLNQISPEDLDFRTAINQQLYRVQKRLARKAIRAAQPENEFKSGLGMSRTAGTLEEEIESLFALAEAYGRKGNQESAANNLRKIVRRYGHVEYPVAPSTITRSQQILDTSAQVMDTNSKLVKGLLYGPAMTRSVNLLKRGLPLYLSTVSPLPKTLHVRAGDLAASKLRKICQGDEAFAKATEALAARNFSGKTPEEQRHRLVEFPGCKSSQRTLNELFKQADAEKTERGRKKLWQLADIARSSHLTVPAEVKAKVNAPASAPKPIALVQPVKSREHTLEGGEGTAWLVLERRGNRTSHPDLMFLGGRVKKRLDNKFILNCMELSTGKTKWSTGSTVRLRGLGQEPGFFEAFVHGDLVVVHGQYDALAFNIADGKMKWRYRVPFNFEIKHAEMSGEVLVLSGKSETVALYVPTANENGEVMWQEKEDGDLYIAPYFYGDRWVSVRKLPFNVTVRYRTTGKLIGRLALPDLTLHDVHPLLDKGPEAVPTAHEGKLLMLTDEWYYIALDITTLTTSWKRLIDQNDVTRRPAMRFALGGDYFVVIKEDYDQKTIYMLSSKTGEVLWNTDIKVASSPRPTFSNFILDGKLYGLEPHPGQGFYVSCRDAKTGKKIYRQEVKGYQSKPVASLTPHPFGSSLVVWVQDRQEFELRVFDFKTGKASDTVHEKGVGSFGVHGRVSATIQNGRLVLVSKDKMKF